MLSHLKKYETFEYVFFYPAQSQSWILPVEMIPKHCLAENWRFRDICKHSLKSLEYQKSGSLFIATLCFPINLALIKSNNRVPA